MQLPSKNVQEPQGGWNPSVGFKHTQCREDVSVFGRVTGFFTGNNLTAGTRRSKLERYRIHRSGFGIRDYGDSVFATSVPATSVLATSVLATSVTL
jgi:hypothetical protein